MKYHIINYAVVYASHVDFEIKIIFLYKVRSGPAGLKASLRLCNVHEELEMGKWENWKILSESEWTGGLS